MSDSSPVTGLADGKYTLSKWIEVEIKDNVCVMANTNTLAGRYIYLNTRHIGLLFTTIIYIIHSITMMDKCVNGMIKATGN